MKRISIVGLKYSLLLSFSMLFTQCVKEKIVSLSDEKEILSFSIQGIPVTVQQDGQTLYLVPHSPLDLTEALVPEVVISEHASITPRSSEPQFFSYSDDIKYVVKAQSGKTKVFNIRIKDVSFDCEILEFNIANLLHRTIIRNDSIFVDVYDNNISLTEITPSIVTSNKATLLPIGKAPQDFSQEVKYKVTSEGGYERTYTVIVKKQYDSGKEMIDFAIPNIMSNITFEDSLIYVQVYEDADITQLLPHITISPHASIYPPSGVATDFSNSVTYTVTAKDGSSANYVVSVSKVLDYEKELISFTIPNKTANVTFQDSLISVEVYEDVDITQLVPYITISPQASILPPSGVATDFSNPVTYTVTAKDGSTAIYKVTVSKTLSRKNSIDNFELVGTRQILERDAENLFIYVPYETDVTSIKTNISISEKASISPKSGVSTNFTTPLTYTVTAKDGTVKNFLVTVKKSPWRNMLKHGEAPWNPRETTPIVFKGKLWLIGGWYGNSRPGSIVSDEIWCSSDGKNWTFVTNAPWRRHGFGLVIFNNELWAMSGDGLADVWKSVDGSNWELVTNTAPWGRRYVPYVAVFKNKLWLMGGINFYDGGTIIGGVKAYNDIWSSVDGINWDLVNPNCQWAPRGLIYGSIVFNNELYILGGGIIGSADGITGSETIVDYNDVWKTSDGITWTRITKTAPWKPRSHFSTTVFDGKIWIAEGSVGYQDNLSNDVWYSSNGVDWTQVKYSFWPKRHASSLVVFNDRLWLIGGLILPPSVKWGETTNDVWYIEKGSY